MIQNKRVWVSHDYGCSVSIARTPHIRRNHNFSWWQLYRKVIDVQLRRAYPKALTVIMSAEWYNDKINNSTTASIRFNKYQWLICWICSRFLVHIYAQFTCHIICIIVRSYPIKHDLSIMIIKNTHNKGTPAGGPPLEVVGEAAAESLWPKHPPPGELPDLRHCRTKRGWRNERNEHGLSRFKSKLGPPAVNDAKPQPAPSSWASLTGICCEWTL